MATCYRLFSAFISMAASVDCYGNTSPPRSAVLFRRRPPKAKIRYAAPPLPVEPAYVIIAVLCVVAGVLMRNHVSPYHLVALALAALGNGILAFRPRL